MPPEPFVTLEISGFSVDSDSVKREFGIEEARTSDEAALELGVSESELAKFWILETQDWVTGNRLSDHLRWLSHRLEGKDEVLRSYINAASVQLLANGSPNNWIRDANVEELQPLGIPLSFSVTVMTTDRVEVVGQPSGNPPGAV